MEVENFGFIKDAFKSFLKCLGLEVVNNSPPQQSPLGPEDSTTYEPLPAADHTTTTDPLVDILSSPDQIPTTIDNNGADENNLTLVTIDEVINMSGGGTAEAHFVELMDGGKMNMSLLATRLISNGGGGKTHSEEI